MNRVKEFVLLVLAAVFGPMSVSAQNPSTENDSADVEEVVEDVIVQPEFDGGMTDLYDYIMTNFIYPDECERRHVSGTVEMKFTVERSGDVTAVSVVKGLDETIDEELIRIFRAMPLWNPATLNGNPVRYTVVMPVTLKLSRTNKNGFR